MKTKEKFIANLMEKIDFEKQGVQERIDLILKLCKNGEYDILCEIETTEEKIHKSLNNIRNFLNNNYCILDCIPLKTMIFAEYFKSEISKQEMEQEVENIYNYIIKMYEQCCTTYGVVNLNFDKEITKQLMNCYMLSNNIDETIHYWTMCEEKNTKEEVYTVQCLNGIIYLYFNSNKRAIKIKYSRT